MASDRRAVEVYRRPQEPKEAQAPAATHETLPGARQTSAPGEMIALTSINAQLPFDEIYVETAIS